MKFSRMLLGSTGDSELESEVMKEASKAEQFILRNSDTKLDTKLRCGFLAGLEFRNPTEFRFLPLAERN